MDVLGIGTAVTFLEVVFFVWGGSRVPKPANLIKRLTPDSRAPAGKRAGQRRGVVDVVVVVGAGLGVVVVMAW